MRVNKASLTFAALMGISLAVADARASITTIDFEDLSALAMANSPGSPVPSNAQLSDQYKSALGVVFSSTQAYVAVVGGATGFAGPTGIGGVATGGLLSYADPVNIAFYLPGTLVPTVYDHVSIQADTAGINIGSDPILTAFDLLGNVIASQTLQDVGGEVFTIDIPGIHSVQFNFPGQPQYGSGTGIALDNLKFGNVNAPVVPEPSSWLAWGVLSAVTACAYGVRGSRIGSATASLARQ